MVKEYMRPDGYRIRASKKAYNMLYKKNGFVPVETATPVGETTAAEITAPVKGTAKSDEKKAKASKGKGKAAASESQKADVTKNISEQEEPPKNETDSSPADQDAAQQLEDE